QKALAIREKGKGEPRINQAPILHSLAILYAERGQYARAEPLLRKTLAVYEESAEADSPAIATSLDSLVKVCNALGKRAEAKQLEIRALAIWDKVANSNPER